MPLRLPAVFVLLFFSFFIQAQISINEYSASNLRDTTDQYGEREDWIELYNNCNEAFDLSGYHLSDKEGKPKKWKIPQGTIVAPKSHILFFASGRDVENHTNFKFTQSNADESIILADKNGVILEKTNYLPTQLSHTRGKSQDGGNTWVIFDNHSSFGISNNAMNGYSAYAPKPKIVSKAGWYKDSVKIEMEVIQGYEVRYTLDGSEPNETSPLYASPFVIKNTAIVKAKSFSAADQMQLGSFLDFATFFLNEPASTLPIISIGSDQVIELAEGNRELKPIASIEVFDQAGKLISTSYGEMDSHGQDSWVNPQRSLDWISRDEMGYSNGIKQKLFSYSERDNFQRIILRASGDDNYPSVGDEEHEGSTHIRDEFVHTLVQEGQMKMDVRALERYLIYLNGQYWGVYTIREKPDDHDYTEHTYNQGKYDIQFLKTWGQSWAEYGGEKSFEDWLDLRDFIIENDMSKPENYEKVKQEYDVVSLMDYMIANLSAVSSDWLNYNTGWWRGLKESGGHKKWGYIMWDNDATFDYYINYSGVPDISPEAKACDIDEIASFLTNEFFPKDTMEFFFQGDSFFIDGEWVWFPPDTFVSYPDPGKHEILFLKLLKENPEFRNTYFARYADMINTAWSCENMMSTLNRLIDEIKPEMPRQIERWGGSMDEWELNIERLKSFVEERCQKIAEGLVECYEVTGPYHITVMTDPPDQGKILLNTLTHTSLPWSGAYFGNMDNSIGVEATRESKFVRWDSKNGNTTFANNLLSNTSFVSTENDTLIAVFSNSTVSTKHDVLVDISFSPNPTNGQIEIQSSVLVRNMNYTIKTLDGKQVQSGIMRSNTIDLTDLASGIYFIELRSEGKYGIGKVVKY